MASSKVSFSLCHGRCRKNIAIAEDFRIDESNNVVTMNMVIEFKLYISFLRP